MQVYITDLEAQEKGHIVGEWVELPLSEDKLNEVIGAILTKGQKISGDDLIHEQILISDYKTNFEIEAYDNIYILNKIAKNINDLLKFRFLIFQGFKEKDIFQNGLDYYDTEIYDFRYKNCSKNSFELLSKKFIDEDLYNCKDYKKVVLELKDSYIEFQKGVLGKMREI